MLDALLPQENAEQQNFVFFMRRYLAAFILSAMSCLVQANAQSLSDLFGKGGVNDIVESVVDQLDVIPKNIQGTWSFSGSAVQFTGDNLLMNAASELAVNTVEDKLDEYLSAVGVKEGLFSYTFNADGTFSTHLKNMDFPGKYTFSKEEKTLVLDYGASGQFKGFSIRTNVSVGARRLQLLFNADKLLKLLTEISSAVGNESSQLGMLTSLLEQYEGMQLGFELTRSSK